MFKMSISSGLVESDLVVVRRKAIKGGKKKGKKYCVGVKEGRVLSIRNNGMGIISSVERINCCH